MLLRPFPLMKGRVKMEKDKNSILLETGTNELEVIVFKIDNREFGVNVAKVQEIIKSIPHTEVPNSHEHIKGLIKPRGKVVPLIDMPKVITGKSTNKENLFFINLEFNRRVVSIEVEEVVGIQKVSWEQMEPISIEMPNNISTGVIKIDDRLIIMIDFERITEDIFDNENIEIEVKEERKDKRIIFAEDSNIISIKLKEDLIKAGFVNIETTENGQEALDKVLKNKPDILLSDIEMPVKDGYSLTKDVKAKYPELPVILFSSLITDETMHKGESVGADFQINKPETGKLIEKIDELLGL